VFVKVPHIGFMTQQKCEPGCQIGTVQVCVYTLAHAPIECDRRCVCSRHYHRCKSLSAITT
jgi:hypothetical protein